MQSPDEGGDDFGDQGTVLFQLSIEERLAHKMQARTEDTSRKELMAELIEKAAIKSKEAAAKEKSIGLGATIPGKAGKESVPGVLLQNLLSGCRPGYCRFIMYRLAN